MRVVRQEHVKVAVVVEVGGENRLAEAADAERGHARILLERAVALADEERRLHRQVVGARVDVREGVDDAVTREISPAHVARLPLGEDERTEAFGGAVVALERAVALTPGAQQVEAAVAIRVEDGRRHAGEPAGVL